MPWFSYKAIPYEYLIDKKSNVEIDRSMITVDFIDNAKDIIVEGEMKSEDGSLVIFELMRSGLYPVNVAKITDMKTINTASRINNLKKLRNTLRKGLED